MKRPNAVLLPTLVAMAVERTEGDASIAAYLLKMTDIADDRSARVELCRRADARPPIVCLCGSTRFWREYFEANMAETKAGKIVLSVGFFVHQGDGGDPGIYQGVSPEDKSKLDELHLRKIDLADEVLVLNVGGYIGDSTRAEIQYARTRRKPVRFLEPERARAGATVEMQEG